MVLSNDERQRRYRAKRRRGETRRIDVTLPLEDAIKLDYLAAHWGCTKTAAIRRMLLDAWQHEGEPITIGR